MRWHFAQMLPRLALNAIERAGAVAVVRGYLRDQSSIVRACALQALVELAGQDESLAELACAALSRSARDPSAAVQARRRKLLARITSARTRCEWAVA